MKKQLSKLGIQLSVGFIVYTIISYLLFLRDDFILERIAFLTNSPWLLYKGRELARLLHVNSLPTAMYLLTIITTFLIYMKALELLKTNKTSSSLNKMILKFALAFTVITLVSFPALSTDVFDYIATNRVLFVHNANPWLHPPQDFPLDDFIYLGSWKFRASVYGPIQFLFSSLVHLFAGNNIIINILGFKITNAIFLLLTILVIKKWLVNFAPDRASFGLALFAWNPLVYIEIIGNAHNDIVMAFFAVMSFYLLWKNRIIYSAVALALAILAKLTVLLLAPLMITWLLVKKRKEKALKFFLALAFVLILGFKTLGEGLDNFFENLNKQFGLYLRSLPTILRFTFLKFGFSDIKAQVFEKITTIPPFLVGYLYLTRKSYGKGLIFGIVAVMILYLLLISPMLQPWYLIWFLPFVAFLPPSRLQNIALVFTFSSLIYYSVLFTSFYFSPLSFIWQVIMFLVIASPPIFVWFMPKNWYTQIKEKLLFLK